MGAQLIEEAECIELAYRMREQVDADAEGAQLAGVASNTSTCTPTSCRLRAVARPPMPAPMTTPRRPDPAAAHRTSCTWMRTVLRSRSPVETAMRSFSQLRRGAAVESRTNVRK